MKNNHEVDFEYSSSVSNYCNEYKIKEQAIIVIKKGKSKIINKSLYQYIKFISNYSFTVFNVKEEEYKKLKQQVKKKEQLDKKYSNCLLINDKSKIDIVNYNDDYNIYYVLINDYGNLNIYPFPDQSNNITINENIIIYTLETYEDIVSSYMHHENVKVKNKVKK